MEQKLGSCKKKKKKKAKTGSDASKAHQVSVYNTPVCLLKPEIQDIH